MLPWVCRPMAAGGSAKATACGRETPAGPAATGQKDERDGERGMNRKIGKRRLTCRLGIHVGLSPRLILSISSARSETCPHPSRLGGVRGGGGPAVMCWECWVSGESRERKARGRGDGLLETGPSQSSVRMLSSEMRRGW